MLAVVAFLPLDRDRYLLARIVLIVLFPVQPLFLNIDVLVNFFEQVSVTGFMFCNKASKFYICVLFPFIRFLLFLVFLSYCFPTADDTETEAGI